MKNKTNQSTLIAVCGAKGAVGNTTVTLQLAQVLEENVGEEILLVDLDVQNQGELAKRAGTEGICVGEFLEENTKPRVIQLTEKNYGYVGIDEDLLETFLKIALQRYQYVIVDIGTAFHSLSLPCMALAKMILLVVLQDLSVIDRSKHIVEELFWRGFSQTEIHILVNRYCPSSPITPTILERMLKVEVCTVVPNIKDHGSKKIGAGFSKPFKLPEADRLYAQVISLVEKKKTEELFRKMQQLEGARPVASSVKGAELPKANEQFAAKTFLQGGIKRRRKDKKGQPRIELKRRIHKQLVDMLELKQNAVLNADDPEKRRAFYQRARQVVIRLLDQMAEKQCQAWRDRQDRETLIREILDEALGLGPLENLLSDDGISEIMVNGPDQVYVEQSGRIKGVDVSFSSDDQLLAIIERIVAPVGRRIDEKSPMVDARLADGSRVNAIISPLSIDGPALTIRKFSKKPYTVDDLISFGSMSSDVAELLRSAVQGRINILVSGGTGSGKTTLLNVLSSFIPKAERIITLEDSAELQLCQPHVLRCEARPPNIEGSGKITIRDLLKNSLRMRPDRIIIGECRADEALDMLQAMNTGHDGSMTTIHANTPADSLRRLETLALFAGLDLPAKAIREQIASAIGIVVQLTRMADGTRKITSLSELCGIEEEQIVVEDIVRYRIECADGGVAKGDYLITGYVPAFVKRLRAKGIELPKMYREIV